MSHTIECSGMRRAPQDEGVERIKNLCRLITLMDGVRALKRVKLEDIDKEFEKVEFSNVKRGWRKIRPTVRKIIELPYKTERTRKLIRMTLYAKYFVGATAILSSSLVYVMILKNFHENRLADMIASTVFKPAVAIPLFLTLPAAVGFYMFMDYKTRKAIGEYEMSHNKKLKMARAKIKAFTEAIFEKLLSEAKRCGVKPENIKLELYFKDYKYIRVLKEDRGRFIKRSPIYVVSPARSK